MFKLLVLAYYYPPMGLSGVQRTLKFSKYMPENGWEPTILTSGKTAYYAHDNSLMEESDNAKLKVVRTKSKEINSILSNYRTVSMPREYLRRLLGRISKTVFIPDNKIPWSLKAFKTASDLLTNENFDAIYVSIPPFSSFSLATKLKKKFDLPVIVDYRDMWFDNHFAFYPTPYHKYQNKKLEDACLRNVDHIVVVNRRVKEKLLTTYAFLRFEDISIIPHGFDSADFEGVEIIPSENRRKKMKILYSGIFYENITPKYFIRAFKKLTQLNPNIAENIELHFVGHFRKENVKLVNELNLHKFVFVHGYLEHKDVIKKIISADVLWAMLGNSKNMETVSAGKIFEYFGTRKPIIGCLPEGASSNALREYGASYIIGPEDVDGIYQVFLDAHDKFVKNKLPVPNEDFVNNHDRKYLTKQLTQILQFKLKEELI